MAASINGCNSLICAINESGYSDPCPFNYQARVDAIKEGLPNDVKVEIWGFCCLAGADSCRSEKRIRIPFEMLFQSEDFPAQFQISCNSDPRLFSSTFLDQFYDYCVELDQEVCKSIEQFNCKYIGDSNVRSYSLKLLLLLLQDPKRYEQAKKFIVAHENAHIEHTRRSGWLRLELETQWDDVEGAVRSIFGNSFALNSFHVQEEIRCDLDAVRALGETDGGIYFFDTVCALHKTIKERTKGEGWGALYDEDGNYLQHTKATPPLFTQRIQHLRQWQHEYDHGMTDLGGWEFPDHLIEQLSESGK